MLFFKPELFAVLLMDALVWLLALAALPTALRVVRRWDPDDGGRLQLQLERQAGLHAGVASLAMLLKVPTLLLFLAAADSLADQITGAMCAVGVLQAGPMGWTSLGLRLAVILLLALWWTSRRLAQDDEDGSMVPLRARLFLLLFLALSLELAASLVFLTGLRIDSLVSCCGTLFAESESGALQSLLALPPALTLSVFFASWLALTLSGLLGSLRIHGLASLLFLAASLAALIQVFSPYVYALPHHHCPFCLLQAEYGFVGYLYYALLLTGVGAGLSTAFARHFAGAGMDRALWLSLAGSTASLLLLAAYPLGHRLQTGVWL